MKRAYSKKHGEKIRSFSERQNVTLHIPRLDRTAVDLQRLPCQIVKISGAADTTYTLASEHGILKA